MYGGQSFGRPPIAPAAYPPTNGASRYGGSARPLAYPPAPGIAPTPNFDPVLVATDPNAFAQMFRQHLSSLTFNSKPIITNLTIIAHEHVHRMANVAAKVLEHHIMQAHPSIRLPALYLLDSICKNVGSPYTTLWAERIVPIFLESYRLVDQPTKMRMEELLTTWRDSGPGGRPLFNENSQWNIERALFGSQGMPPPPTHQPTPPPQAGFGTRSPMPSSLIHQDPQMSRVKAIESIDRLLALGSQDLSRNPGINGIEERMESLRQLKQVLHMATLSAEEMIQVHAQLDSLTAASKKTHPSPPPVVDAAPAMPPALSFAALANLGNLDAFKSATAATIPAHTAGADPNTASALIASLMQAGLLPSASSSSNPPSLVSQVDQDDDYVNAILALSIKTSGPEFSREPPCLELILHKHLPLQCRQCANRYPKGDRGQKRMDEHLDWHFTQNRRAKDSAVRGQSRSWFDKLESFIRGGFDDSVPFNKEGDGHGEEGGRVGGVSAAQEKALKEKFAKTFVIAPSDAEISSKPCPICKESFKSQWSEDEEEWIWLNAIEVDDVYYHASCHYSAKTLSESVADRAGSASVGVGMGRKSASRTATPSSAAQQVPSRSTPAGNPVNRIKEEGILSPAPAPASVPATPSPTTADSPGSRKRKADLNEDEDEPLQPVKKLAP